jgi:hypothetical protein
MVRSLSLFILSFICFIGTQSYEIFRLQIVQGAKGLKLNINEACSEANEEASKVEFHDA